MVVTSSDLAAILPHCPDAVAWIEPIGAAMAEFAINTPKRQAMFLAQIGHESDQCNRLEENLRYSTEGLLHTFPKYFSDRETAARYAWKERDIANRVYGDRMGNGGPDSGDGYRFRGRGLIQLTGRAIYKKASVALGRDYVGSPDLLTLPIHAARSAAWFFVMVIPGVSMADARNLEGCTRRINGGLHGLTERAELYHRACQVLEVE